jgi:gas vesicle protein
MNPKIYVGYLFAFISGLTLGALTALLLAPTSGEELRGQIRVKADASGQQLKADYGQARQWVTDETGKLRKGKQAGEVTDTQ